MIQKKLSHFFNKNSTKLQYFADYILLFSFSKLTFLQQLVLIMLKCYIILIERSSLFSNLSTPGEFIKDNEENLTINENRTGGEIPWCMLCSIGHAAKGVEAQLWLRMEERRREERRAWDQFSESTLKQLLRYLLVDI